MTNPNPTPTIALFAVPGAGDSPPGGAARAVADLLLRLGSSGGNRYTSFVERAVRIPTSPARVNPRSAPNVAPDLRRSIFAEQHAFLRTQFQYGGAAARDREEDSPDHQLMRAQLADYRSTGEPYDTVRLEGERLAKCADDSPGNVQARLHVYEVRWPSLSRLGSGPLRAFAELYQLFFHLAHLGRVALDHARLEHAASSVWRAYGAAHGWAVRLLTLAVPAVLVAMLATVAAAALPLLVDGGGLLGAQIVAGTWLLIAGAAVYLGFRAYERLRPGAMAVGLSAYLIAAGSVAIVAVRARDADELLDETIQLFEVEAAFAAGVWGAVYLLGAVAGGLALLACARARGPARSRAWRVARTAALTLVASTTSVLIVTFVLWAGLFRALDTLLPARPYTAVLPIFHRDGQSYEAFFTRALEVTAGAGFPLLILLAVAVGAIGLLAVVPALIKEIRPPQAGEVFEQHANGESAPRPDAPVDTDLRWAVWERLRREGDRSQRLGRWITHGLRLTGVLIALFYVAVFLVAPAMTIASWATGVRPAGGLGTWNHTIVIALGGSLTVAAIALVAFRGRLERLTFGLRPAVDLLLQMDNYLRTHPAEATPRARIAERYVSVLRYLCHWRDPNGRPYDAIILVAHSQGAVITADLLNFVQREEDPDLEPIRRPLANGAPDGTGRRLYLFTMGSPLRQLYSQWLPHLFGWVRGETGDGVSRPLPAVPREPWMLLPRLEDGHRVLAPAIPDGAAPDPYAMGLTRWVNAYRSGDYVGRAHWRHAVDEFDWIYRPAPPDAATRFVSDVPPITYVSEDAHRSRRELCIGAGAHTHYWDATAKGIAIELDLLISDASRLAMRVARDTGAPAEGMES
jgi:hypothetical protein